MLFTSFIHTALQIHSHIFWKLTCPNSDNLHSFSDEWIWYWKDIFHNQLAFRVYKRKERTSENISSFLLARFSILFSCFMYIYCVFLSLIPVQSCWVCNSHLCFTRYYFLWSFYQNEVALSFYLCWPFWAYIVTCHVKLNNNISLRYTKAQKISGEKNPFTA